MRAARPAFLFLTLSWIVLLLAAPVVALGSTASGITYVFGSFICHQRPERSFHLGAAQLPVCARCFGIYLGAAVGALAGLKPCATPLALRRMVLLAAAPTAITWGFEVFGLWSPSNVTRFIAALPLGGAVAVTINYLECARPRRTGPNPPPLHT